MAWGAKPTPASCTVSRTRPPSSRSVLISNCLGRSSTALMASDAFRSRFRTQNHPVSLKFTQRQGNYLSRSLVQVHRFNRGLLLAEERAQSRDYLRRTVAIANGAPRCFARTVDIWRVGGQHAQTSTGVGDDSRQRLADFVRDRRRQRSKACDPCYVCQFRSDLPECLFRPPVLCHVLSRADVYQSTLSVSRSVTDQVQIFDRVVGHLQPVFVFKIATDASRPVDHVIQHRDIFRMDSTTDQFKRYRYIPVKLKNAIKLL